MENKRFLALTPFRLLFHHFSFRTFFASSAVKKFYDFVALV